MGLPEGATLVSTSSATEDATLGAFSTAVSSTTSSSSLLEDHRLRWRSRYRFLCAAMGR